MAYLSGLKQPKRHLSLWSCKQELLHSFCPMGCSTYVHTVCKLKLYTSVTFGIWWWNDWNMMMKWFQGLKKCKVIYTLNLQSFNINMVRENKALQLLLTRIGQGTDTNFLEVFPGALSSTFLKSHLYPRIRKKINLAFFSFSFSLPTTHFSVVFVHSFSLGSFPSPALSCSLLCRKSMDNLRFMLLLFSCYRVISRIWGANT